MDTNELFRLGKDCQNEEICAEASTSLAQILPVMLRFMADEYDDTCSTVFPLLQTILSGVSNGLYIVKNRHA